MLLQRPASCRFTICMCERDTERHMVPRRGGKHLEPARPTPLFFISDSFHLHQTCPDRRAGSPPPGALVKTVPSLRSSLIRVETAGISGGWRLLVSAARSTAAPEAMFCATHLPVRKATHHVLYQSHPMVVYIPNVMMLFWHHFFMHASVFPTCQAGGNVNLS